MKKQLFFPLAAVAGGAAALVLRLLQNRTGYEPDTGLPIPGNVPGMALALLLAALAVTLLFLVRLLPREGENGPSFPEDFRARNPGLLALPIAGIFLMAASGVLDLLLGAGLLGALSGGAGLSGPDGETVVFVFTAQGCAASGMAFSPRARLLAGGLGVLAAVCLFPAAAACRGRPDAEPRGANPAFLLVPPVCLVMRLVLTYRVYSVNPVLQTYYVEILALAFLTLAFYRLSAFAYRAARTRRFALYAGAAVAVCIAALADGTEPSGLLFYAGGALSLLGFLLLWLTGEPPASETAERGDRTGLPDGP